MNAKVRTYCVPPGAIVIPYEKDSFLCNDYSSRQDSPSVVVSNI